MAQNNSHGARGQDYHEEIQVPSTSLDTGRPEQDKEIQTYDCRQMATPHLPPPAKLHPKLDRSNIYGPVVMEQHNYAPVTFTYAHAAGSESKSQQRPTQNDPMTDYINKAGENMISKIAEKAEHLEATINNSAQDNRNLLEEIKLSQQTVIKKEEENQKILKGLESEVEISSVRSLKAFGATKQTTMLVKEIREQTGKISGNVSDVSEKVSDVSQKVKENQKDIQEVKSDVQSISSKVDNGVKEIGKQVLEIRKTTEETKTEITRNAEEHKAIRMKQDDIETQLKCVAEREATGGTNQIEKLEEQMDRNADETRKKIENLEEKVEDTKDVVQLGVQLLSSKIDDLQQSQNPTISSLNHPKLQKNAEVLIDYMAIEPLVIHLFSTGVLTMADKLRIQAGEIVHDKVERLLLVLDKKPDGVEQLKSALLFTDQEALYGLKGKIEKWSELHNISAVNKFTKLNASFVNHTQRMFTDVSVTRITTNKTAVINTKQRQRKISRSHNQIQIPNIKNMSVDQFRDYLTKIKEQEMLENTPHKKHRGKVPNICHFTWLFDTDNHTFDFIRFMSMLSIYNKHGPDQVYFWHESLPVGPWWNKILNILKKRRLNLKLMHINSPGDIYGRKYVYGAHKSDIVRLLIIQVFGGIYMDLDILIVRSLLPLMKYDFVMGEEIAAGLNNGLLLGIPGAKFLSLWLQNYKESYDPKCWACSSIFAPRKISKSFPQTVHVETKSMHHPNWAELHYIYMPNQLYDWSDNFSVHLWYRIWADKYKVSSIEQIQKQNTTLGQIMRWIWFNSTRII